MATLSTQYQAPPACQSSLLHQHLLWQPAHEANLLHHVPCRYGVTSYEAMHNGTGSYGGMGYDTDDGPAPTRTGMGTRAVLARALQRSGNSISAANHNKRKSAPEKIPGGYNSPFKLLFSRGTAQQSTTTSYMPAGGIVPGMQMQQMPLKQVCDTRAPGRDLLLLASTGCAFRLLLCLCQYKDLCCSTLHLCQCCIQHHQLVL